jgi:hypothetical protein
LKEAHGLGEWEGNIPLNALIPSKGRCGLLVPLLTLTGLLAGSASVLFGADLALLVGDSSKSIGRATAAIERLPGVKVTHLYLLQGITNIDAAVSRLQRFPFDGVVALGNAGHQLFRSRNFEHPYAATLVTADLDDTVIPNRAPPEEWAGLLHTLLPQRKTLTMVCPQAKERKEFQPLFKALQAVGWKLMIELPRRGEPLKETVARSIPGAEAFFLQRSKALLKRKILLRLLKEAHTHKVPLLGFSNALVKAGALASLQVSPEALGVRAAETALKKPLSPMKSKLSLNTKRAEYLGLQIPKSIQKRLR